MRNDCQKKSLSRKSEARRAPEIRLCHQGRLKPIQASTSSSSSSSSKSSSSTNCSVSSYMSNSSSSSLPPRVRDIRAMIATTANAIPTNGRGSAEMSSRSESGFALSPRPSSFPSYYSVGSHGKWSSQDSQVIQTPAALT